MDDYCTVLVKRDDAGEEAEAEEEARPANFEELIALFKRVRVEYAELFAAEPGSGDRPDHDWLGGVGVEVTNRWGEVSEVGYGRDACFIFRLRPQPSLCYSDHPPIEGTRVFYLDGGHHTELGADMLASPAAFLRVLRRWLDEGVFPECGRA